MENLVKESKKYGNYTNKLTNHTYSKIEVIAVEEMFEGKRMDLPTSKEVLKDADRKNDTFQQEMF